METLKLESGVPEVSIYADGSGKASEYMEGALRRIREREEVLKLQRLFIAKHAATLAGAYWNIDIIDPEIEVHHGMYRGKKAGPKDIARLWPDADWRCVKPQFSAETQRDWVATVDGVTIRIARAECIEPMKLPKEGTRVRLVM